MRRMYTEQQLTAIIREVFDAELASGALDEKVSDAVDAYLVENPVDITALEGKTITPAVVNATTSMSAPSGSFETLNGEASPSVKPIYWHGISLYNNPLGTPTNYLTFHILNNTSSKFESIQSIIDWAEAISGEVDIACNGFMTLGVNSYSVFILRKSADNSWKALYNNNGSFAQSSIDMSTDFAGKNENVNKIN